MIQKYGFLIFKHSSNESLKIHIFYISDLDLLSMQQVFNKLTC